MTELDYLKMKLEDREKAFVKLFKRHMDLLKQQVELENEIEQLKEEYTKLKHNHSLLHDECLEVESERDNLKNEVLALEKENEELKKQLNELNKYCTACDDTLVTIQELTHKLLTVDFKDTETKAEYCHLLNEMDYKDLSFIHDCIKAISKCDLEAMTRLMREM